MSRSTRATSRHALGRVPSPGPWPPLWQNLADALSDSLTPEQVELKAMVAPHQSLRNLLTILSVDRHALERRIIYFLDTPDLDLFRRGIVVRIRRTDSTVNVVVKLRRSNPNGIRAHHRTIPGLTVEIDALPDSIAWTAAVPARVPLSVLRSVLEAKRPVWVLLSPQQRRLVTGFVPATVLDDITVLGPVMSLRARTEHLHLGRRASIDIWKLPGGRRLVEVSTKCVPKIACRSAAAVAAALARCGVALDESQYLKTDAALAQFIGRVPGSAAPRPGVEQAEQGEDSDEGGDQQHGDHQVGQLQTLWTE